MKVLFYVVNFLFKVLDNILGNDRLIIFDLGLYLAVLGKKAFQLLREELFVLFEEVYFLLRGDLVYFSCIVEVGFLQE